MILRKWGVGKEGEKKSSSKEKKINTKKLIVHCEKRMKYIGFLIPETSKLKWPEIQQAIKWLDT